MERENSVFKNWLPKKLLVPLLILALFPHFMLLTMFNMNSTFTASFLDVEVDDLQFLFSMAYATIVCGLFIHVRFFQFFNIRSYLLLMTILNIIVLFLMTLSTNPQIILILRFIQGPLTVLEGCILLPLLMSQIKSKNVLIIAYSILYGYMMTSDKFATSIIKFAIENYSHNMIIYTVIIFHILALIIYVTIFNQNRMFPKKPLYQLNLSGIFILIISLVSGAYFFVYGKKNLWFESPKIVIAFALMISFGGLFILYQKTVKRPMFRFEIFKSEHVVLGVMMFFFFYVLKSSMSNIYQVMSVVWKWPWEYVLQIQYFNVAGSIIGVVSSYFMMVKKLNFKYIFALGFILLASSLQWFSYLFYPDTTVAAIAPPLLLEGIAQGVLFTPLVLYMLGSVHPSISGNVGVTGTAIRFWSTTIGFAIMQNIVLHLSTKNEFMLTKNLDITNPIFQDQWNLMVNKNGLNHLQNESLLMSATAFKAKLSQQALLITNVEIFRALAIIGLLTFIVIILYRPLKAKLFGAV